eukprot:315058_1
MHNVIFCIQWRSPSRANDRTQRSKKSVNLTFVSILHTEILFCLLHWWSSCSIIGVIIWCALVRMHSCSTYIFLVALNAFDMTLAFQFKKDLKEKLSDLV